MTDTIFAVSSGAPPAAIAVLRISGPGAGGALKVLAGDLPRPRRASLRRLRAANGEELDRALVLWFQGPESATGEDCGELHCHGGRAVVAAVETRLAGMPGLRHAEPGEFTRRAFLNGRIDLAEAEGLADLLTAETELQRRAALAVAGGGLSRQVDAWRSELLGLSAVVEAALDFSDEDDVGELPSAFSDGIERLSEEISSWLARPHAERLRDGVRVVFAGPPNAGKSALFNALLDEAAAIVSAEPGTTRDVIQRSVAVEGVPLVLIDTAGLREAGAGEVEAIGIARAHDQLGRADIVLWLGPQGEGPAGAVEIAAKADLGALSKSDPDHIVSSETGSGVTALATDLAARARGLLPVPGEAALNARQRQAMHRAHEALLGIAGERDLLLVAEHLRVARAAFDRLLGRSSTEEMLDALFGRFCIGK